MKKVFATLTVLAMLTFGSVAVMAQEDTVAAQAEATEQVEQQEEVVTTGLDEEAAPVADESENGIVALHKTLKTKFIEGGAGFMAATLL